VFNTNLLLGLGKLQWRLKFLEDKFYIYISSRKITMAPNGVELAQMLKLYKNYASYTHGLVKPVLQHAKFNDIKYE
jgi:hypothetical protein